MNYDLFVDESCHLEHDKVSVMSIGYIKVPKLAYEELKLAFKNIKKKHSIENEIKWSKFSIVTTGHKKNRIYGNAANHVLFPREMTMQI